MKFILKAHKKQKKVKISNTFFLIKDFNDLKVLKKIYFTTFFQFIVMIG